MTTVDPSKNIWVWGLPPLLSHPSAVQTKACETACRPTAPANPAEYSHLRHTIHASLRVLRAPSPSSGPFSVKVINGSDGKVVHLGVSSEDTIAKLQAQLCEERPELKGLGLAFNGKPVMEHQSLLDLGVKEGAMFVTYRRCRGG